MTTQSQKEIQRATEDEAALYEYRGSGANRDIVARVKSHHSDVTGVDYRRLSARKIASDGRRGSVTTVVVVGPEQDNE